MTAQEIIKEVQLLPPTAQREVMETLSKMIKPKPPLIEAEAARILLAKGVISEIPVDWDQPDEDFEPIKIKGKPISETILEDRE